MKKKSIILILFLLTVLIVPLSWRVLLSPDEDRYAEIAREMIQRNDWVTPYLNGVVYFEKPVGGYWLMAGSMKLFGENAFAVRLPCMLSALLCALCIFLLVRRWRNSEMGVLSACVFLCFPFVFVLGGVAILDMIFTGFLTAGMTLFFFAEQRKWDWRKVLLLFLCGGVFGFAFLTKGFLALALPGSAIFFYYLLPAHWRDWRSAAHWKRFGLAVLTLPWIPLLGLLTAVLPWAVLIHQAQPDFWHYFFFEEHIQRFTSNAKTQHNQPFWFFFPILPGGCGLVLIFLWETICSFRKNRVWDALIRYSVCWVVFEFLLLSCSSGKLGTYILPCYPALAILFAEGIYPSVLKEKSTRVSDFILKLIARILAILIPLFLLYEIFFPKYSLYYGNVIQDILLASSACVVCVCFEFSARNSGWRKLVFFGLAMCVGAVVWNGLIPPFVNVVKEPCRVLEEAKARLRAETAEEPVLISFPHPFQSVCWVFRRDDVYMYLEGGELSRGIDFMKAHHRILNHKALLREIQKGERPILLIVPNKISRKKYFSTPPPRWKIADDRWQDAYRIYRY